MQDFTRPTLRARTCLVVPRGPHAELPIRSAQTAGTKSKTDCGLPEDKCVPECAAEKYSVGWQACFD
jgi:hypothetical protein